MKCPKCGADNADGASSCRLCHAPLAAPDDEAASAAEPTRPKRRRARMVWLICAVVILAVLGAGAYYQLTVVPGKVALAHARQEITGQLDALAQLLPQAAPLADAGKKIVENSEVSVKRVEPGLNEALVHIETTLNFGGQSVSFTQPVCLDREGLGWQVNVSRTVQKRAEEMGEVFGAFGGGLEGLWGPREQESTD